MAEDDKIRVLIVEDQTLLRRAFARLLALEPGIEVVAEAPDGAEAVQIARARRPDVILMDIQMPRLDGIAATRRILAELPETRIVILTTFDEDEQILAAVQAGAVGYLLKESDEKDIAEAVRQAHANASSLSPKVARKLMEAMRRSQATAPSQADEREPAPELTPREAEILEMLMAGKSNRMIALALDLAEGTVKNHVSAILGKHDARSRAELMARSIRR